MSPNLRDRLRRIQNAQKTAVQEPVRSPADARAASGELSANGWEGAGYLTLRQVFQLTQHIPIPAVFPRALPFVIPDIRICAGNDSGAAGIKIQDLLFFDLETTGLSGGAGTVAFLAAFGRLIPRAAGTKTGPLPEHDLHITQYLLQDYPGENDFLEAVLAEFAGSPLIVSYNGKAFDSQILKTRCLMNAIQPPQYLHADLLHPARRLWKRLLENCSQATIEEQVLGLDRSGDVSGALAPEIWFDFLRTGRTGPLMAICEHNRRDIRGLASIFAVMALIAADPIAAFDTYSYDTENLALRWHDCMRHLTHSAMPDYTENERTAVAETGKEMLQFAAEKGGGRAALVLAIHLLRSGFPDDGRQRLEDIARGNFPATIHASALRFLAIDSERYRADCASALDYVNRALNLDLSETWKAEFEHRKNRLLGKLRIT